MGSPLFDGYRPRFDAASVQGLRESGAVILGKTVTQNSPSPTHGGRATPGT
jgi:Asp-tRNA(Asn)/Glu-tRNA(Gln) amidotransferase A subunit family amidase